MTGIKMYSDSFLNTIKKAGHVTRQDVRPKALTLYLSVKLITVHEGNVAERYGILICVNS